MCERTVVVVLIVALRGSLLGCWIVGSGGFHHRLSTVFSLSQRHKVIWFPSQAFTSFARCWPACARGLCCRCCVGQKYTLFNEYCAISPVHLVVALFRLLVVFARGFALFRSDRQQLRAEINAVAALGRGSEANKPESAGTTEQKTNSEMRKRTIVGVSGYRSD